MLKKKKVLRYDPDSLSVISYPIQDDIKELKNELDNLKKEIAIKEKIAVRQKRLARRR